LATRLRPTASLPSNVRRGDLPGRTPRGGDDVSGAEEREKDKDKPKPPDPDKPKPKPKPDHGRTYG
jgi:hypothetical protein